MGAERELSVAADSGDAQRNAEVVRRFFERVLAPPHEVREVDEMLSEDFVDHTPDGGNATRAGVGEKLRELFAQDPHATFTLEALVAAGDRVAAFSVLDTGGARSRFADLYTVREGRIAEHWHVVEPVASG